MIKVDKITRKFSLKPIDNNRLMYLCGCENEHINNIESVFKVIISNRSCHFKVFGENIDNIEMAIKVLKKLYELTKLGPLNPDQIDMLLHCPESIDEGNQHNFEIKVLNKEQDLFLNQIQKHDITFGVGPSGTGKTFLAVASAVYALKTNLCKKIILVRPAVEAGEKIGYLPGDMAEKINPYLQPLYDALYELMGFEQTNKLIENQVIEINLLAFMRGRTFKNSFIIIDEAQNCTSPQMKMALTRIGYKSKMVIIGDQTQSDLSDEISGFDTAITILKHIPEISMFYFSNDAIVRHRIVHKIVQAYEK